MNKRDEFEHFITENEIDIVGVTETWLSSMVSDSELNIKNVSLFRQDREKKSVKIKVVAYYCI